MACPTCDHTMHGLGEQWFWCPRCGTVLNNEDRAATTSIAYATDQMRNFLHNPDHVKLQKLREHLATMVMTPEERSKL